MPICVADLFFFLFRLLFFSIFYESFPVIPMFIISLVCDPMLNFFSMDKSRMGTREDSGGAS